MTPPSLRYLALSEIHPDPGNPRDDETPSEEMVESIRDLGILQALLVKTDGDGFVLVDGHRRWRGAMSIDPTGFGEIPCLVVDGWSATQVLEAQIATGIHARGLNPIEQAKALARLQKATGTTQRAAASLSGLSQAKVSQLLLLLRLTPQLQAKVASGEIGVSTALGYNRAPSRQLVTRGYVDPRYDELRDAVTALGKALLADDEAAIAEHSSTAYRSLSAWMPDDLAVGRDGDAESTSGPSVACPYCPERLHVEHPAGPPERARARRRHLAGSDTCRRKHDREMRQAGLTG